MAVTALPRALASTRSVGGVHPAILLVSLAAPALDLLGLVQSHAALPALPALSLAWCAVAGLLLLVVWARHPREAWLAAAVLALIASGGLRFSAPASPQAPLLSLLAVLALGVGGAFASAATELDLDTALGDA